MKNSNNYMTIQKANREMLDYFNDIFISELEEIQDLKTQVFEISIKIEELQKTKNLYSFKSGSRRNIFSLNPINETLHEQDDFIDKQIADLQDVKSSLEDKIRKLEFSLKECKSRLNSLNSAEKAIQNITQESDENATETTDSIAELEFIETPEAASDINHGYNILMQTAFNDSFLSTLLDRNVKEKLVSVNHKLELLSYLIGTDMNRAKVTLRDAIHSTKNIITAVDDIHDKIDHSFDTTLPMNTIIDDYITHLRDIHPEFVIEPSIECTNKELVLHPVFAINTIKLLDIFFDNAIKHSDAKKIQFNFSLSQNVIEAEIIDDGTGIPDDYISKSPWYSGIHKANELIYLLNGNLVISPMYQHGTKVRFSFSIKN